MTDAPQPDAQTTKETPISWEEFLANHGPPTKATISDLAVRRREYPQTWWLAESDLVLHCPDEQCGGDRAFYCTSDWIMLKKDEPVWAFQVYVCRNCRRVAKTFAVLIRHKGEDSPGGVAVKVGEWPPFGPPVPSKLMSLIGPDRQLFLQGRRSENHGLGIGAVAYYRRVVENQKNRLLDEVIKVGEKTQAPPEVLDALRKAKEETQFSRAMDDVKDAIPPVLRIDGVNPFALLHTALSKNLHNATDEECLAVASSIRIVLTEMSERIAQVLKDQAELKAAVARLR